MPPMRVSRLATFRMVKLAMLEEIITMEVMTPRFFGNISLATAVTSWSTPPAAKKPISAPPARQIQGVWTK